MERKKKSELDSPPKLHSAPLRYANPRKKQCVTIIAVGKAAPNRRQYLSFTRVKSSVRCPLPAQRVIFTLPSQDWK